MPSASIKLERITHSYPNGRCAIRDFNLAIYPGERIALLGASGVGKSTLLDLIAGWLPLQSGSISIDPVEDEITRIGYVFQTAPLLPWYTVEKNILLQADCVGITSTIIKERSDFWMARLGLLQQRHHFPSQLSGGEMQRASLAMTFVLRPNLLLLDEPTSNLDFPSKLTLENYLITSLYGVNPATTILVTHDIDQALILSDRVLVLSNGRDGIARIVHEVNVELDVDQRLPENARSSAFVRDNFSVIWRIMEQKE